MGKIYSNEDDKFIKTTIVYSDNATSEANNYIYSDHDCTVPIPIAKLNELFFKGCIVYDIQLNHYSMPISFKREAVQDESGNVTGEYSLIIIFDYSSGKTVNLYSSEYKFPTV